MSTFSSQSTETLQCFYFRMRGDKTKSTVYTFYILYLSFHRDCCQQQNNITMFYHLCCSHWFTDSTDCRFLMNLLSDGDVEFNKRQ